MGRRPFVLPNRSSPTPANVDETYAPKRPRLMAVAARLQNAVTGVERNTQSTNSMGLRSQEEGPPSDHHYVADDLSETSDNQIDNDWNLLDDSQEDGEHNPLNQDNEENSVVSTEERRSTVEETADVDLNDALLASASKQVNQAVLDPTNRMAIDLLNLSHDAKIPLIYYDRFVRAIKKGTERGADWKKLPSRDRINKILTESFPMNLPQMLQVPRTRDVIPKFNVFALLMDLLKGKYFCGHAAITKCCVNPNSHNRFERYVTPPKEGQVEVTSGSWYEDTYSLCIGNNPVFVDDATGLSYKNWLLPVIIYNDKTGVSAMEGSYSLEPFMFSLGVIRRAFRENPDAWRHFGFIPSFSGTLDDEDTENNAKKKSPEEALAFTHECLRILLHDLVELQKEPPLVTLKLFDDEECRLRLVLQVAFVIGDQLSQDTHCCRKKINAGGAGRVHRSCLASYSNATTIPEPETDGCHYMSKKVLDSLCDNVWLWESTDREYQQMREELVEENTSQYRNMPIAQQRKIIETTIKVRAQLSRDIIEKVFSVYPVRNAWSLVSFGSNVNGIHRATLDDPMHYNSSGLCAYILEIAFQGLLPNEAKKIETYLREDFKTRSSVRYDLPRGKYNKGFTNCTLQTASERVGMIYSLYLSLDTDRVKKIYKKSILRQQRKYCDMTFFDKNGKIPACPVCRFDDKYFFKKEAGTGKEMPRTETDVKAMMTDLNDLGLLKQMEAIFLELDDLQTEYLFQASFNRVSSSRAKDDNPLVIHDNLWRNNKLRGKRTMTSWHKHVMETMRLTKPKWTCKHIKPPTTIQRKIQKHWLDKPIVKGTGNTSAILTDIEGFRIVLENVLLFHALVHEFHQLPSQFHDKEKLIRIESRIFGLLDDVFNSIYRGDNGIDVQTCKCHSHFHLIQDILAYGSPMGFEASKGERNLKIWAKGYSKIARKCGQNIFIEQTAKRVAEHMTLQQANQFLHNVDHPTSHDVASKASESADTSDNRGDRDDDNSKAIEPARSWQYTRKNPHLIYNISTDIASNHDGSPVMFDCSMLLTDEIKRLLRRNHGGEIQIWKDIRIDLGNGQGHHNVRAYHEFDRHGSFFDWAAIDYSPENDPNEDNYRPALVLLLYKAVTDNTDYAIVWNAREVSETQSYHESNILARWSMDVHKRNRTAKIQSIKMQRIKSCISVFKHWRNAQTKVHNPLNDTNAQEANELIIDEQYEVYSWLLNLVDESRWVISNGESTEDGVIDNGESGEGDNNDRESSDEESSDNEDPPDGKYGC